VRPEGANQPGELSIDPVADERLMRVTAWVGCRSQAYSRNNLRRDDDVTVIEDGNIAAVRQ
jgi:hypothetical protein